MVGRAAKDKPNKARITATERRREALDLRRSGLSFEQIGERLGITRQAAYKHVSKALDKLAEESSDSADKLRALELERLDKLLLGCYADAATGDLRAVDRALRIIERRAKLLGLDAPSKIASTTPDGEGTQGIFVLPAQAASVDEWLDQAQDYSDQKTKDTDSE